MTRPRVVIGMSGGVDSSVAAWLLKQQGYDVVGLFMKNWEDDDDDAYCSTRQDLIDAAAAADVVGIELEAVNFAAEYKDRVFAEFLREYSAGRTPNPDVLCNAEIKFKAFLDHALKLGAERIATGHYARVRLDPRGAPGAFEESGEVSPDRARVRLDPSGAPGALEKSGEISPDGARVRLNSPGAPGALNESCAVSPAVTREKQSVGRFELLRGVDPTKDQSYFLHRLNQAQLARTLFPIGHLRKTEVRRLAAEIGLPNAKKKDSTGICFIGERPFREFLNRYLPMQPGPILDADGRRVGEHVGLAFYTLGQRKGIGVGGTKEGSGEPWFVARKDMASNTLWVVQGHDHPWLMSRRLTAMDAAWVAGEPPQAGTRLAIKTRYRQGDAGGTVTAVTGGRFELVFDEPQWAVTPGQSAVLYDGEVCLGGGVISARTDDMAGSSNHQVDAGSTAA